MDLLTVLQECEAFAGFDEEALERLALDARALDCSPGEVILRHGHPVDFVGVVWLGAVAVKPPGPADPTPITLEPGMVFGEMSLLTGEPAVADVVASTPSRIACVPHASLTRELGRNPLAARPLAKLLTQRITSRQGDPRLQEEVEGARREDRARDVGSGRGGTVLVLNCGSSSVKYALVVGGERRAGGLVERIGLPGGVQKHDGPNGRLERSLDAPDHQTAIEAVLDMVVHPEHGAVARLGDITAVGHRTVHGGERFSEATFVTPAVKEELKACSALAPLHNPVNLLGIEVCERLLPGVPQVAVFDTAFHLTMPEHAWRYSIPKDVAAKFKVRRYGFHGTSHKYVSRAAAAFLGRSPSDLKIITCHLGNGASCAAIDHGRSVDTSMGMTPLEGLVMGTRSGDVDPGILLHLMGQGVGKEELDRMLNKESGLLGLSGVSSDMRELEAAADEGDAGALLAIQVFCYRIRKYIGAYTAAMGGVDALVFTGGIGENGVGVRSRVCQGLACLGIELDEHRNRLQIPGGARASDISTASSPARVLVVRTDEESMIATETTRALDRADVASVIELRRDRPIPIGVSAHHVHLSQNDVEVLYGAGHQLTARAPLTQPGQFACQETVDLVGPKGRVDRVRVLGPVRNQAQVEISRTEEFKLGIDAPIRASGDLRGSPGLELVGPNGKVRLAEGVICALRHIHMTPEDALTFGVRDRDVVRVEVQGERSLIFGDVLVRVHPDFRLEMHIDTDEANAAEVNPEMVARLDSIQHRAV
ncbi:MAG TPA: acetate/propionate family kinase [Longimicrobiales bacterium]|nr:acetate/propionate family kinase [Longimicrobiales bacterium]